MWKFFSNINNGLNICVDYCDTRVRTGKFTGDLRNQRKRFEQWLKEKSIILWKYVTTAPVSRQIFLILIKIWKELMKIPLFEHTTYVIFSILKVLLRWYREVFLTFAITFPAQIILLNLYENAIIPFFLLLLPMLILMLYCYAVLYQTIDKQNAGEHITIWQSFRNMARHLPSISFPFFLQVALILETILGFFMLGTGLGYAFIQSNVDWANSFLFWLVIIFLGIWVIIALFIVTIVLQQAFFAILLQQMPILNAIRIGWGRFKTHLFTYLFFNLLLFIFCFTFSARLIADSPYLGFTMSAYILFFTTMLLSYVLQRRFKQEQEQLISAKPYDATVYGSILFLGICNFLLIAFLITNQYTQINVLVNTAHTIYLTNQQQKQYVNNTYNYLLEYPQAWNVYQRPDSTVTFYNNSTGTVNGGTWLTISVTEYKDAFFQLLYNANPGIVVYETGTKNVTTKVSNISVQGYSGVNYTFVKSGIPYNQYETHYLIHKGNLLYDLAFVTVTNDVEDYNSDLFTRIINSFRFIEK